MTMHLSAAQQHIRYGLLGLLMGLVLSYAGFGDYSELHKMFTFVDLRLLFTFAGAVGFAMMVFWMLGSSQMEKKTLHPGTIPGSILFGAGWAITGACPSLALVQLGQGYLSAILTLVGILGGAWIYRHVHARYFNWDTGSCG